MLINSNKIVSNIEYLMSTIPHFKIDEGDNTMKIRIVAVLVLIFAFGIACTMVAQEKFERKNERKLKKAEEKLKAAECRLHSIEIPEIHIDLSGLEESMQELEVSLKHLEHIEIPDIQIPHIYIPPIHIPEIDLDLSHLDFDFDFDFDDGFVYYEDGDWDHSDLFEDLSEGDQLKIAALRSISRQDADKAIPAMEKVIKEESNPALRYEAVRHLRRFLDDKRVVPLLGKVAKNDKNVDVRKKAILLLGKSGDKRAVKILEELAER